MRTVSVKSSVISSVSHDPKRESIIVAFRNGVSYEYKARPDADPPDDIKLIFLSFISADSAGEFFAKQVRNKLPFRKLESEPAKKRAV